MILVVTGASGYVGSHLVPELIDRGHSVIAVTRAQDSIQRIDGGAREKVTVVQCDLQRDSTPAIEALKQADMLVHLAWSGLSDFCGFTHIESALPCDIAFLTRAVRDAGVTRMLITGTCLEYGMKTGGLTEEQETTPTTAYGLAKDTLRKALELLAEAYPLTLQWARLFYVYGEGKSARGLLAALETSIERGDRHFDMSPGDQLRDFISITQVADDLADLVDHPEVNGVINCATGKPVSVLDFVDAHCRKRGANLRYNRGRYDYPIYEPLAFWGIPEKLSRLRAKRPF